MIEGPSGLLNCFEPSHRPIYEPSKRRVTFHTGATAITYSGDEPDQLRGPNIDSFWVDELAACRLQKEIMEMLAFCLRIGSNPRGIITTTPKPTVTVKGLVRQKNVVVTRGSTFENRDNLSPVFFDSIIGKYENTRIGRQELMGEILEDNPKALWKSSEIDQHRVSKAPIFRRIVIGVDPAISANKKSDETGIVAVAKGVDDHFYVLDDHSCKETPSKWGKAICNLYDKWEADKVIGEVNQGGDMVSYVIKNIDPLINFKSVRATRGKKLRAEPVASLYESGKVHHLGVFPELETQMVEWNPEEDTGSPDRIDALCWAIWELMDLKKKGIGKYNPSGITDFKRESPNM
jgi:phage terminase large subunit-like protein